MGACATIKNKGREIKTRDFYFHRFWAVTNSACSFLSLRWNKSWTFLLLMRGSEASGWTLPSFFFALYDKKQNFAMILDITRGH
jgi:hypothetical protein